jgi:hypothetical protein
MVMGLRKSGRAVTASFGPKATAQKSEAEQSLFLVMYVDATQSTLELRLTTGAATTYPQKGLTMVEQVDDFDLITAFEFTQLRPFYDTSYSLEKYRAFVKAHRIAGVEAAAKIVEKDAEGMSWSESASISGAGFELIKRAAAIRAALNGGQHE